MFLKNHWYVAASTSEIGRTPLRRVIMNEPVVMYRTEDSTAIALEDRCPHLRLPLSMGKLVGDDVLQCYYHGLRFDRTGACVRVPGQDLIPPSARIKSYPLVDRYKWLEPRHMVNISDRWNHAKTDDLQFAFFNGIGWESWENIWGIWNGITPHDAEATRRVATIVREAPMRRSAAFTVALSLIAARAFAQAAALPDSLARRIDAVYAPYRSPAAPGCVVGVFQNGAVAYAKGYGSANIDYDVPITPRTPFIMGSVSKQFTATTNGTWCFSK